MTGTPFRIEAEDMILNGYRLETHQRFASSNVYTSLYAQNSQETATATTLFGGVSGTYDIVVAYFDEDDGVSAFDISINNNQVDAWTASNTEGGWLPSAQALVRRTISGVTLFNGDSIVLTGTEDAGEAARIDYIELIPISTESDSLEPEPNSNGGNTPFPVSVIRVEAENMALNGYRLEKNQNFASGRTYTSLFAEDSNETATATTQFNGTTGTYDIVVAYFDEDDGASTFSVQHNGNQIDTWIADGTTGGWLPSAQALVRRTISGVTLTNGDSIQLAGAEDAAEAARIDYIEFISTDSTPDPVPPTDPVPPIDPVPVDPAPTTPPEPTNPPGATIRIEAENMTLNGYRLEKNQSFASGRAYTSLFAQDSNETATATTLFNGTTGTYNIVVAYFDEDDGASTFNLRHNGNQIDTWIADGTTGGWLPSAQALVRRTITGVTLTNGDSIQLAGTEDAAEAARIDYIEFISTDSTPDPNPPIDPVPVDPVPVDPVPATPPEPTNPPGATIRIEAENMTLNGYRLEKNQSFASGRAYTSLFAQDSNETATATTQFNGIGGTYDIVVAYFDEDDGASTFSVQHNSSQIDTWTADSTTGGWLPSAQALVRRTISGISLSTGDSIRLTGTEDAGEAARIDYIEFVPISTNPPTGSNPLAGSNGIIEIMPLGDSITRGEDYQSARAQQNGYRDDLAGLLDSAGVSFDFVGSQSHGSGFDTDHEGHGGWKINQLFSHVNGWLDSYKPEIILLQIGTNDIGFTNLSISNAVNQLGNLIDRIVSKRPVAQLVVSSIAPANPANFSNPHIVQNFQQRVVAFNSQIPGLVSSRFAQGKLVTFADIYGALDENQHLSADGFHPNDSGYDRMADVFYDAIAGLINANSIPDASDRITGSNLADTLTGFNSNDVLTGLGGGDTLTGGGGADEFAFSHPGEGRDEITDFSSNDSFEISASGFGGGLQSNISLSTSAASTGVLVSGENPVSLGQSANFLYNTSTQTLSFDQDGLGTQYTATELAQINGTTNLSVSQFHIV